MALCYLFTKSVLVATIFLLIGLLMCNVQMTGENSIGYQNLFDALLDSTYFAIEKAGGPNVEIVVSETGWPSNGHPSATSENAQIYYRNLVNHVKSGVGTPKKPGRIIETYLFAMFDENQKQGEVTESHFGLFYPNQTAKYDLKFMYRSNIEIILDVPNQDLEALTNPSNANGWVQDK
ncbi:hypothetical protein H5410_000671 [Solanum commersonii]|uniref:Glucan endo-1,3-beta-D-glucosidase n=1 Tax=Solanum commersonii TaxID=4109 RepID=A0A9J6AXF9_SOLCO|nr:hypothetical protein H5410_000671 [Solanum commersonii]